jgi:hypothetical protein
VNWKNFSGNRNPNAIPILVKNLDKVEWDNLSNNENICDFLHYGHFVPLDFERMKDNARLFSEELVAYVFHPLRLERMGKQFDMNMDEYLGQI